MRFQSMLLGLAMVVFSNVGFAENYTCSTLADPDHGFEVPMTIRINSLTPNARFELLIESAVQLTGTVSEVTLLEKSNAAQADAFNLVLGYLLQGGMAATGVDDFGLVSSIQVVNVNNPKNLEIKIFRLFNGETEIGGTFLAEGHGTACLVSQ